jgi:hypothetical protein
MIPSARPQQTKADTLALIQRHKVSAPVVLVGVRGYYLNSMGRPGVNDFGVYDDALILVSSGGETYATFNANTDPSRLGYNKAAGKQMAVLKPGLYHYKLGLHGITRGNPYQALVQAGEVTVLRGDKEEAGWFGVNIHRGSNNSTSSQGCVTLPPAQWPAFIALVKMELKRSNAPSLSFLLTERKA